MSKLPTKAPDEARTENPTVRMSPTTKKRVKAAAKRQGYSAYTEFMHDVIVAACDESESDTKARGRKAVG